VLGSRVSDVIKADRKPLERKVLKLAKALHPARISELALYLLKDEAISGKFILGATALALLAANTGLASHYEALWDTHLSIGLGKWVINKDLQHWINEALMAIFFLVVGLELKRELVYGELRKFRTAVLPFAAALGGMIIPAVIYLSFNLSSEAINGWAIPMATDIAFAIGILALLGRGIPSSLRLFLLTLAIVDDIGAVIVIAIFYSQGINPYMLATAALICGVLLMLGRSRKLTMLLYALGCIVLWLAINASGIHASIAGALMGLLAPVVATAQGKKSIAERTEHFMIPISTLVIVPLFAFANTGVILSLRSFQDSSALPIALGIIVGLVFGKVMGIVGASWLMVRLKYADQPKGSSWGHMVGIGLLAGIGFTVSIFVTELAFDSEHLITISKLSIFLASAISGCLGLLLLRYKKATS
jgi:NhaA family Na+:H+ antiporter